MEFNSLFFFLTLLPFLALYGLLPNRRGVPAKCLILGYSYFFYGMWNPAFLILIMVSTGIDYAAAIGIERMPRRRKAFAVLSLVTNLGLLGFFKYFNFVVDLLSTVLAKAGVSWQPGQMEVLLPVGISFYTFQTLSYTLDVYRGELRACRSLLDIAVFVAFFPQLVAGPIVRARDFLPQLRQDPKPLQDRIGKGVFCILLGLVLKCVVGDGVAGRVDNLFAGWKGNAAPENWLAAFLFGVQIYGDFAGYSLTAIGLGMLMGFELPQNFRAPYASVGFSEFWRRWHITLSTWLRDYLYISMGGSRKGGLRTFLNLMVTMLLGGLWHGASLLFLVWGGVHGAFL